jgi:hypothetical protein
MSYKSETCFRRHDNSPLTTYTSFEEAENSAEYINIQYSNNLIPYECDTCSLWHLTPKDRHTQSKECDYCTDSNGSYKQLYFTESDAQKRADILFKEHGVLLNIYKCPHSHGFHLTKK